jgi:hypothetical protein
MGRQIWPGNYDSQVASSANWPASELVGQVLATRADKTATGNVHYSAHVLFQNLGGLADQLTARVYGEPALIPEMPWLQGTAPDAPGVHLITDGPLRVMACFGDPSKTAPRWWVLRVKRQDAWTTRILPGAVREMSLGALAATDSVALSGVDRTGREGAVSVGEAAKKC